MSLLMYEGKTCCALFPRAVKMGIAKGNTKEKWEKHTSITT